MARVLGEKVTQQDGANMSEPAHSSPPRRRVLFLLPSLGGGGAERVVMTLLQNLDRNRFEPHLALLKAAGPYLKDVPHDVPVHDLKIGRVRYALPVIVWLAWKLRPQAVLSTLGHLNFLLILAQFVFPKGMKLLVREATTVSVHIQQAVRSVRLWTWLYRHLYKRADTVICLSEYMLADLRENLGVPRQKLVCIYNPVDLVRIRSLAEECGNPYTGNGPHLVAAGRLSWEKGFDLLLDAMPLVRKKLPHAQLTILGQGPLESHLKAQRERLGLTQAVDFAGFRLNPYPFFKHADLFALSSRYEGLPNAALEAMGLGTPVVATDCIKTLREVVPPTYPGLVLCPPTKECLAESILAVLARGRYAERNNGAWPHGLSPELDISCAVRAYESLLSHDFVTLADVCSTVYNVGEKRGLAALLSGSRYGRPGCQSVVGVRRK